MKYFQIKIKSINLRERERNVSQCMCESGREGEKASEGVRKSEGEGGEGEEGRVREPKIIPILK